MPDSRWQRYKDMMGNDETIFAFLQYFLYRTTDKHFLYTDIYLCLPVIPISLIWIFAHRSIV